jgi:hypothetical protein
VKEYLTKKKSNSTSKVKVTGSRNEQLLEAKRILLAE